MIGVPIGFPVQPGAGQADYPAIGTSTANSANGVLLYNRTAAASGAQQYSPIDALEGQGWKTDATAASQACVLYRQARPVQGAAAPTFAYWWSQKIGAAAAIDLMSLSSAGLLSLSAVGGGLAVSAAKALAATPTEASGLVLRNSTAAALGAQQWSPAIYQAGQAWETTGSSSDEVIFRSVVQPIQGATADAQMVWSVSLNGGAYSTAMSLGASGQLTVVGGFAANGGLVTAGGSLRASGDSGGSASTTTYTHVTAAGSVTAATIGNTPAGIAGANAGWIKIYVGATAAYIPYWTA